MTENIIGPEETKRLQYLGNYYCNQWRSLPKREERRKGEGGEEEGELRVRSEHSLVPRPLSEKSKKGLGTRLTRTLIHQTFGNWENGLPPWIDTSKRSR